MHPMPAIPHICGSTTVCTSAAVTAASTTFPPPRSTSAPASAASGCGVEIIPWGMGFLLQLAWLCRRGVVQFSVPDNGTLNPSRGSDRLHDSLTQKNARPSLTPGHEPKDLDPPQALRQACYRRRVTVRSRRHRQSTKPGPLDTKLSSSPNSRATEERR